MCTWLGWAQSQTVFPTSDSKISVQFFQLLALAFLPGSWGFPVWVCLCECAHSRVCALELGRVCTLIWGLILSVAVLLLGFPPASVPAWTLSSETSVLWDCSFLPPDTELQRPGSSLKQKVTQCKSHRGIPVFPRADSSSLVIQTLVFCFGPEFICIISRRPSLAKLLCHHQKQQFLSYFIIWVFFAVNNITGTSVRTLTHSSTVLFWTEHAILWVWHNLFNRSLEISTIRILLL